MRLEVLSDGVGRLFFGAWGPMVQRVLQRCGARLKEFLFLSTLNSRTRWLMSLVVVVAMAVMVVVVMQAKTFWQTPKYNMAVMPVVTLMDCVDWIDKRAKYDKNKIGLMSWTECNRVRQYMGGWYHNVRSVCIQMSAAGDRPTFKLLDISLFYRHDRFQVPKETCAMLLGQRTEMPYKLLLPGVIKLRYKYERWSA